MLRSAVNLSKYYILKVRKRASLNDADSLDARQVCKHKGTFFHPVSFSRPKAAPVFLYKEVLCSLLRDRLFCSNLIRLELSSHV